MFCLRNVHSGCAVDAFVTDDFSGWDLIENGGDKWKVDRLFVEHPDVTVRKNFVTSYL